MDTLFRLVSPQQYYQLDHHHHQQFDQSLNSTTTTTLTSTSSHSNSSTRYPTPSSPPPYFLLHPTNQTQTETHPEQQECFLIFMDHDHDHHHHQDDFSSSSTTNNKPTTVSTPSQLFTTVYPPQPQPQPQRLVLLDFSKPWASHLLLQAAKAIADQNTHLLHKLMWALNELASPYGDTQQKLASYFLQAIFSRIANSGRRSLLTLSSASDRTSSFDSTRKLLLRFQEVSPWSTFGHVSSNGAILESLGAHPKLHVLDFSNTFCTQWPTFLESLATRYDDTPHLRLTSVVVSGGAGERVMNEISARMDKFARLMGVPFQFDVIHHSGDLSDLNFDELGIRDDEALAINCIGSLRSVSRLRRDDLFSRFRKLRPRIVTLVEEEADLDVEGDGAGFVKGFEECLRWFGVYFECLDESFPKTSNERLVLERRAGRAILDLVACSPEESTERREMAERWSERLRGSGFLGVELSEEVSDDVKALLRRYKEGWSLRQTGTGGGGGDGGGMLLCWKEQPVVWASAWRPIEH